MAVPNLGELNALTEEWRSRELIDNIANANVILMKLTENEETYDGGTHIRENVIYDLDSADTTGGSYSMTQTLNHVEREGIDAARFQAAYYYQTVVIWRQQMMQNHGSKAVVNLINARLKVAMMRFRNRFSRHIYASGTGTNNLSGLLDLMSTTNTYGEIDRSAQSWWQPYRAHNSGTGQALTQTQLDTDLSNMTDGNIKPDLILTSDAVVTKIKSFIHPNVRYKDDELKRAGVTNILYEGIPVVADKHCNTDSSTRHRIYYLNFDFLKWRPHSADNFAQQDGGWRWMENGAGMFTRIYWSGNMTCNNCRYQGSREDVNPSA